MKENDNAKGNSQILSDMIEKYILLVQKQIADTTYKYINVFLVHKSEAKIALIWKLNVKSA
ncbi:UNVERIFIED_CONTAM: hypothetical protein NCL1_09242 [Trichonephila clavipes]